MDVILENFKTSAVEAVKNGEEILSYHGHTTKFDQTLGHNTKSDISKKNSMEPFMS